MSMKVELKGEEDLERIFKKLGNLQPVKVGIKAAGEHVEGKVKQYPPRNRPSRKSVYGQSFVSDRQRKAFFAGLRDGSIEVPYRRGQSPGSQGHAKRWNTRLRNHGLTAIVGNNSSYGPLLQDADQQSRYMKAVGWKTTERVMEEERKMVNKIIRDQVRKALRGR